jgi:hypothetical protein
LCFTGYTRRAGVVEPRLVGHGHVRFPNVGVPGPQGGRWVILLVPCFFRRREMSAATQNIRPSDGHIIATM